MSGKLKPFLNPRTSKRLMQVLHRNGLFQRTESAASVLLKETVINPVKTVNPVPWPGCLSFSEHHLSHTWL